MNLPCPINGTTTTSGRTVYLYVSFSGGTINVTGSTAVQNCKSATLSGSTVWDVVSGATADLTDVTVEAGTSVTKAGSGTLVLKSVPASFAVTNGTASLSATIPSSTALQSVAVRDRGTLTVDVAGASIATLDGLVGTLAITKPNLTVAAVASGADLSGSVTVDLASFTTGGTVVTTPDAALRAKVLAAAQAAISAAGASLTAEDSGSAVALSPTVALKVFDSTTVADLADANGWRDGDIPGAGEIALVGGNGVTGTLTVAALAKGWSGITLRNGATLRLAVDPGSLPLNFEAGTTLAVADGLTIAPALAAAAPNLVLEPGATLALADGEEFSLPSTVRTESTSELLSKIIVGSGATLTVPAGYAFKNVGLVLDGGTLAQSAVGTITFGTAAADETTYFAMAATNATIRLADGVSGNPTGYRFACPASGGAVKVVGEIVFKNSTIAHWPKGFALGESNPTNDDFSVVLDNTSLTWYNGALSLAGASSLVVSNGTTVTTSADNSNDDRLSISGAGQLVIGEDGTVFYPVANNGNTRVELSGEASDRPAIVLAGGVFEPYKMSETASARTIAITSDSTWQVFEDTYWWDGIRNILFDAASETTISAGATLTIRNRKYNNWEGNDNSGVWFADKPISGAGNVVLTNAYDGKAFAAMLRNGSNTATGAISAIGERCTLVVSDGANWAGTVVANGNVALTNGAEAASVSFGTLRLDADFPVRAWRSVDAETGRTTYSCDTLAVGAYTGTGALAPVLMNGDDDECFPFGATLSLGTIGADSAIPRLAKHWRAIVVDGEGDARNIKLKFGVGFSVMIR